MTDTQVFVRPVETKQTYQNLIRGSWLKYVLSFLQVATGPFSRHTSWGHGCSPRQVMTFELPNQPLSISCVYRYIIWDLMGWYVSSFFGFYHKGNANKNTNEPRPDSVAAGKTWCQTWLSWVISMNSSTKWPKETDGSWKTVLHTTGALKILWLLLIAYIISLCFGQFECWFVRLIVSRRFNAKYVNNESQ